MKKQIYLLPLLLFVLAFTSCEEKKEADKYDNWRERNEAFIDSLQNVVDSKSDPSLLYVTDSRDKKQNIFYKKITSVDDGTSPVLTSKVRAFFRGVLLNEEVFGAAPSPRFYTKLYKQLDVFDKNFTGDDPSEFDSPTDFSLTGGVINGWTEILQHMKPGERWEVYIPYGSAYGSTANGATPAYSTLIFDIDFVKIVEY